MNATPASSGPNLGLILALTVNGPGDEFFRSEKEMRNVRYQGHRPDTGCCWKGTYPLSITLPVTYGLSVGVVVYEYSSV